MSERKPPVGSAGWIDLTVADAPRLRDFYSAVVGWKAQEISMGDYADYAMAGPDGEGRAGVCHKRGANAGQPSVWMVYFVVADLAASAAQCSAKGGKILVDRRKDKFVVLEDPAGAVCALYQG